ncbi:MAG: OsmY domain-containing protein [Leptothrix sp. (in: Bacteria)]|nr:OsmY domain-containing protein [Leptothrix sp. (in: b-proteobacteria)]
MKTDAQLKQDVEAELAWEPSVNAAHVGVAVKDSIVTLSGHIDTYAEKYAIERAARRVHGVLGVAIELDVKLDPSHRRSDSEIAAAAEAAFRWNTLIPHDRILLRVEKGWVTLNGEVDWDYQRQSAEHVVRSMKGVVGVSNAVTLKPRIVAADISNRIRDALIRHADEEAKHIEVTADGGQVMLQGKIGSWIERTEAIAAAWAAPGVHSVSCQLQVQP